MKNNTSSSEKRDRLLIYGIYTKLIDDIKQFDTIQAIYRTTASTFLLATFVAIGFLFSSKTMILPIDNLIIVILICMMSLGAISTICFLDLVYQERLVISCFCELYKLEKQHPWLPQPHRYMLSNGEHPGGTTRKIFFYIGCGYSLILLSGLSLTYILNRNIITLLSSVLLTIIACILYYVLMVKITGNFKQLVSKTLEEKS